MSGGERKSNPESVTYHASVRNGCWQDAPPTQEWGRVTGVILVTIQPPRGDRSLDVLKLFA